ncbi:MAG TPA: four helix bundle protein [Gemmatimonadales bacterium]|nr:four helix bundle protein [Gemmatimonadales bacterium]
MSASERASGHVRGYRDLLVWQDAMDLVVTVYRTTAKFPKEERYALVDQLRRAAVAVGSLMEIETQVQIATRLGYIPAEQQTGLLESTAVLARMLAGLIRALRRRLAQRKADSRLPVPDP